MKSLAILGASGHGKVVADAALLSGWEQVVFYDDRWPDYQGVAPWNISGDSQCFLTEGDRFDGIIIAIGNNRIRLEKIEQVLQTNMNLVTIIHPNAVVSRYSTIERGSVIFANAVVNPDCTIGVGSIINTGATVDHDCHLGRAVHVSPGANLAGGVVVGDLTWIGIGSAVRQTIKIGAQVIVGAGAVVVKNIPDNCTVIGVPAEIID